MIRIYLFTLILLCTSLINIAAQDKKMAITIDDLPVVHYGNDAPEHVDQITRNLLTTLRENNIPAIGFVNESGLYPGNTQTPDTNRVKLITMWLENGLELGNHTFSHKNYHQVPFDEFANDVLKGEKITKPLSSKYDQPYRFFRHPFLRIGRSKAHADSLVNFLHEHGYQVAPVTIDNEDYIFAHAYHIAFMQDDPQQMKKIGEAYVDYMTQKIGFYEKSSEKLFDRQIAQTLLIHANLLNAHYLDDLVEVYQERGYQFVSQQEVLQNPAYQSEVTRYGNWGISWIDRWAISQKVDRSFFQGDPLTPDFVNSYIDAH